MTFWERFYALCIENKTKPNPVASKIGIPSGTITGWKAGANPSTVHLQKLSGFFDVSVDYLLGNTEIKKEQVAHDEQPASKEIKKLYEESADLSE